MRLPMAGHASARLRCLPLPDDGPGLSTTRQALQRAVTSSAHRLSADGRSLWVGGQDRSHHAADPCVATVATSLGLRDGPATDASQGATATFGVCLEDSWSGHALARILQGKPASASVTLLHLDDHLDLGPTLLARGPSGCLVDRVRGQPFDATDPQDWVAAIGSGAVNIGNWLTAALLGLMVRPGTGPVTVRHLVPPGNEHILLGPSTLVPVDVRHDVLPDDVFAGIERRQTAAGRHRYLATQDVRAVFDAPMEGLVILHVDLDVFANDFNGGPSGRVPHRLSDPAWRDAVLNAIGGVRSRLAGAVVATSPGFCAAWRWRQHLAAIEGALGGQSPSARRAG